MHLKEIILTQNTDLPTIFTGWVLRIETCGEILLNLNQFKLNSDGKGTENRHRK
jgi:hypothetical protein